MKLEEIKKLANLARIDMSDEEMEGLAKDFDPILAYVSQVKEALNLGAKEAKDENYFLQNVMRDDVVTNQRNGYTDKILNEIPERQDGYLKVKKIL